jgi:hypothetical protein
VGSGTGKSGVGNSGYLNDLWKWDGTNWTWSGVQGTVYKIVGSFIYCLNA